MQFLPKKLKLQFLTIIAYHFKAHIIIYEKSYVIKIYKPELWPIITTHVFDL